MKQLEPKFRCTGCNRGILNRSVARCLYCGADLPAEARLAPEVIAQRDAEHARMEEARKRLAQHPPPRPQAQGNSAADVIDGMSTGIDVIDLIGDGVSLFGKLLD
ncbi:hypothetical protein SAMN05518865_12267 [Duganella sp. CF458]|uniref:hypothetical protein n=1 Tax=Duganella sp. CF458 TaxID=1884368 RepID=UPI0008ED5C0B|nr:hypothetical protein [Duganella sp. CF458]SFG91131.1 hypothetical protein SAMN05518865_12267 [Duganella sp. CF458]